MIEVLKAASPSTVRSRADRDPLRNSTARRAVDRVLEEGDELGAFSEREVGDGMAA